MGALDKIRWHCRRGSLELDLILQKFADAHLARLNAVQLDAFSALLECEDADLTELIAGRVRAKTPAQQEIVERIRVI